MKKFYAISSQETKKLNTQEIRDNFLVPNIFKSDEVTYNYTYYDRTIIGGVMPVKKTVQFHLSKELGVEYFLQRRELGLINIGGEATICVDDIKYKINSRDGLYVSQGTKKITVKSNDVKNPAKIYFMSVPGLIAYPTTKINIADSQPLHLGQLKQSNKRTIYKYFHPDTCKTNQLLMGMTLLEPNNMWNTMPPHTHERRMEAYLYFNINTENRVFHFMGQENETRHIVVANEEAVISPSWSLHSGVGTGEYAFIWAMAGENQTFTDMQNIAIKNLK